MITLKLKLCINIAQSLRHCRLKAWCNMTSRHFQTFRKDHTTYKYDEPLVWPSRNHKTEEGKRPHTYQWREFFHVGSSDTMLGLGIKLKTQIPVLSPNHRLFLSCLISAWLGPLLSKPSTLRWALLYCLISAPGTRAMRAMARSWAKVPQEKMSSREEIFEMMEPVRTQMKL